MTDWDIDWFRYWHIKKMKKNIYWKIEILTVIVIDILDNRTLKDINIYILKYCQIEI